MESHKNTNANSTKHISSSKSDKCLPQITSRCRWFQTIVTVTVTTQPYHTVYHFRRSSLIITLYLAVLMRLIVAVLHYIRLLFFIPRQLSTSNFSSILPMQPLTGQIVSLKNVFPRHLATKISSSVNWLPLYDHFPTVGLPLQNPG